MLHLGHGAAANTDTYFGRFPASYFQRWTTATSVEMRLTFDAEGPALLLLRGSDSGGANRIIASSEVTGTGTTTMSVQLDSFVDGGALWMEFHAVGGRLTISDMAWTVAAPPAIRSAAIAICTFNRADECEATLSTIASDRSLCEMIEAIYVTDQGRGSTGTESPFQSVATTLGEKLIYLRQPNLGGAGGFSRGLYEALKSNDSINVILMDDDIMCEPESLLRLNAFANLTRDPMIVGSQMLFLRNPRRLYRSAESTDLPRLSGAVHVPNGLFDVDMVKRRQHKRVDAQYNAWWSCLIPAEVVKTIGLPLPLFLTWDDIEYGLRAAAANYFTVTLPNAGVWHAEFHWKDRDNFAGYFGVRNALITHALHRPFNSRATTRWLTREIAECLASMKYGRAYLMVRGIEDFLAGPSTLDDGGAQVSLKIREEWSAFSETKAYPAADVSQLTGTAPPIRPMPRQVNLYRLKTMLVVRLFQQWFGLTTPGPVAIPAVDNQWWHVSRFDYAIVTDSSQGGVRIRRRDARKLRELSWRAVKALRRFRTEATAVQQRYISALPTLAGLDNWERLFADAPQE
ncbi:glycosyltransferase [Mycobacterium sp. IDR2000157661]|uniref:glycosyltransferase n=1 Tax=Mycobacterium sp. IDR2000157661 TaxID=2867005 RepID=UPI001EEF4F15|nr:glycosyltransferase [Mycobacterium sp. IDR2000157661]